MFGFDLKVHGLWFKLKLPVINYLFTLKADDYPDVSNDVVLAVAVCLSLTANVDNHVV